MKAGFSVLCVMLCLCFSSMAYSDTGFGAYGPTGFYISGNIGTGVPTDSDWSDVYNETIHGSADSDAGLAFTGAAGYNFGMFRLEGELAYQQNDFNTGNISFNNNNRYHSVDGDTSVWSGLVNGYFDFHNSSRFTPFVGGGIGLASIDIDTLGLDDDDSVFAWQVGCGVAFAINDQLNLDLTYRYFATEDPEYAGLNYEFSSNNFYAGLRYQF